MFEVRSHKEQLEQRDQKKKNTREEEEGSDGKTRMNEDKGRKPSAKSAIFD